MPDEHLLIGRAAELASLQSRYDRAAGQLALVYGRRRIGKSFLLEQFARGKPTVFYQATQQAEEQELESFTRAVQPIVGGEYLPEGYRFPSWEHALDFVVQRNRTPRLLLILDEFPYLADSTPGLPSIIQRWWDRAGKDSSVMLVLCGSAQTFMGALDAQAAPLHQRFTAKIHVGPVGYLDAAAFTPTLSAEDKARVYAILGGTPLYLRQWNETVDVRTNLLEMFADPASTLVDSAELVLSTDIQDARAPYRALQAIALGASKHSEIHDKAKLSTERVLPRLIDIGLVEKRTPATEHPQRTKRSIYAIADNYFRFYFRFVAINRGQISRGLGVQVIDNVVLPHLDEYMGPVLEAIAREFARALVARGELPGDDVGTWWSTDGQHEIDVVGTLARKTPTFIGSVKWRREPLGEAALNDLERDAQVIGLPAGSPRLLIGRGGMASALLGRSQLRGYSIDDLYNAR